MIAIKVNTEPTIADNKVSITSGLKKPILFWMIVVQRLK